MIWCSIDSCNELLRDESSLSESPQITIILTEGAFFAIRDEKLLPWLGIEPGTLDFSSQSVGLDHFFQNKLSLAVTKPQMSQVMASH